MYSIKLLLFPIYFIYLLILLHSKINKYIYTKPRKKWKTRMAVCPSNQPQKYLGNILEFAIKGRGLEVRLSYISISPISLGAMNW